MVKVDTLVVKSNVRSDTDGVRDLAKSIDAIGLRQRIQVRKENGKFIVIDGHRRLKAIKLLKMKEIPNTWLDVFEENTPVEVVAAQIASNQLHQLLSLEDEIKAVGQLLSAKNIEETAAAIGHSVRWVRLRANLRNLISPLMKDLLENPDRVLHYELIARYPQTAQEMCAKFYELFHMSLKEAEATLAKGLQLKVSALGRIAEVSAARGPCAKCDARSSVCELFVDEKTDTCLDPTCRMAKIAALCKGLLADNPGAKFYTIGPEHSIARRLAIMDYGEDVLFGCVSAGENDKGAIKVVFVDGPMFGTVGWVVPLSKKQTSSRTERKKSDAKPKTLDEKRQGLEVRRYRYVAAKVREFLSGLKVCYDGGDPKDGISYVHFFEFMGRFPSLREYLIAQGIHEARRVMRAMTIPGHPTSKDVELIKSFADLKAPIDDYYKEACELAKEPACWTTLPKVRRRR